MVDKFRASEAQEWNSHGNMGRGKVKKKLTTRTLIKGHALASSASSEPSDGLDTEAEGGQDGREPSPSNRSPSGER